ncbi:DinB family protein [Falsibacillus albus]|uniref:DinB family protein n=1 Tax=Falsibacillus albus TaxID=2478915 RepID=A0A3L7K5U8_9BACI|nr:DinB family protein [Falsibacillus albus]RLQ96082.1 DinB family protein [Falsibacillus albus]
MNDNEVIREELFKSVSGLSDEQLNQKPSDDEWSIMQVLEHLYLMESAVAKSITAQVEKGKINPAEDKPIHLTPNRLTKVSAPSYVVPSVEPKSLEEMKGKLAASRELLNQAAAAGDPIIMEKKSFPHPVFGDLSLKQWVPFVGYHEKRHIHQIEEIKHRLEE